MKNYRLLYLLLTVFIVTAFVGCLDQNAAPIEESVDGTTENVDEDSAEDSAYSYIWLDTPAEGSTTESPLYVIGHAPGNWFFEGVTNMSIYSQDDNTLLAEGLATVTSGDWMTTESVTFEATINFEVASVTNVRLVLNKANPSGLEENADSYKWTLTLSPERSE